MNRSNYTSCIAACEQCARACEICAESCLQEGEVQSMLDCIRLDRTSAEICRLAALWMTRGGRFVRQLCLLCAEICEVCAKECSRHVNEHCRRCAEECRRCAEECRRIVAAQAR